MGITLLSLKPILREKSAPALHVLRVDQTKASKGISNRNSIFDLKAFIPPLEGARFVVSLSFQFRNIYNRKSR
jgi:hypothetical protein